MVRHVSIPCVLLSEDLLLRLKPVIKRTLTDASFVVLEGSCGDPFVEICRHGRCVRTRFRSAGGSLARCLRCGRLLRFHEFPPMSSITNQIGDGKARPSVRRCQGLQVRSGWRERPLLLPLGHKGSSGFYRRSGRDDVRGAGDESCSVRVHQFEVFYSRMHSRFAPDFAPDSRSNSISFTLVQEKLLIVSTRT